MTYYGRKNTSYTLGAKIKGGGEGEVFEISGRSDLVAKIYFDNKFTPTPEISSPRDYLKEKIMTMLDQPVDPLINNVLSIAWPQDILFDSTGKFVGYTMPRVHSKYHIFAASRERERRALYSNYTWKIGILISYNLALAIKKIHETGAVVGDLNPNNIMLDSKGHVTLIDTDSFNITNKKTGKTYKCSVGVPEMLPPELQGKNLAKSTSVFTAQTDSFALSIHIFNLLMNNCHPFGCVGMNKSQSSSSNNPVVHNIVKGHCPYVSSGNGTKSPDAPDIMMLPSEIRILFDRAFSYDVKTAVKSSTINNRPSAEEWQSVLWKLYNDTFATCKKDSSHLYIKQYGQCPWCAIKKVPIPAPTYSSGSVKQGNSSPNNSTTSSFSQNYTPTYSSSGTQVRRDPWVLYLVCIVIGCVSSPFLGNLLVEIVDEVFSVDISLTFAYIALGIIGAISGGTIAFWGSEHYETAYNGWPWLLLGLLAPIGSIIITAAIMLVIGIVILALYIIGILIALACAIGICSGG